MAYKTTLPKPSGGRNDYYRTPEGKICDKRMSPYGLRRLMELQGAELHFTDAVMVVKGNKLVDKKTGDVVENIDNDRMVNKIIFKVM